MVQEVTNIEMIPGIHQTNKNFNLTDEKCGLDSGEIESGNLPLHYM